MFTVWDEGREKFAKGCNGGSGGVYVHVQGAIWRVSSRVVCWPQRRPVLQKRCTRGGAPSGHAEDPDRLKSRLSRGGRELKTRALDARGEVGKAANRGSHGRLSSGGALRERGRDAYAGVEKRSCGGKRSIITAIQAEGA